MNTRTVSCETRVKTGMTPVTTQLTIDLSNLTEEHIVTYALETLVIKRQAQYRKAGTIPQSDVYVAPIPGTKTSSTPMQQAEKLTIEQLEAIILRKKSA